MQARSKKKTSASRKLTKVELSKKVRYEFCFVVTGKTCEYNIHATKRKEERKREKGKKRKKKEKKKERKKKRKKERKERESLSTEEKAINPAT